MFRVICAGLLCWGCLFFTTIADAASPCYQQAGGAELTITPIVLRVGEQAYCSLDLTGTYTIPFHFDKCASLTLLPMDVVTDVKALFGCDKLACSGTEFLMNSVTTVLGSGSVGSIYGRLVNTSGVAAATVILVCSP